MTDRVFDFKIREELRKMTEFEDLTKLWSCWTRKEVPVCMDRLIDIITYCSKGDLDLAIRGLRSSLRLLARGGGIGVFEEARDLLVEVWRLAFISTRCVLDWDDEDAKREAPSHEVLEGNVADINVLHDLHASKTEKRQWMNDTINGYKERNLLYNRLWKAYENKQNLLKKA